MVSIGYREGHLGRTDRDRLRRQRFVGIGVVGMLDRGVFRERDLAGGTVDRQRERNWATGIGSIGAGVTFAANNQVSFLIQIDAASIRGIEA